MLMLNTRWGSYLLGNAVRIDIFKQKEKTSWDVYLSVDSYKHLLHGFQSQRDASFFVDQMKGSLDRWMYASTDMDFLSPDLDEACEAALHETELSAGISEPHS